MSSLLLVLSRRTSPSGDGAEGGSEREAVPRAGWWRPRAGS